MQSHLPCSIPCLGLKPQLLSGFTAQDGSLIKKEPRTLYVIYEEESYMARQELVRGCDYNLIEQAHMVTGKKLDLAPRNRKHFPGTNRTNGIGPVAFSPFTKEFHLMLRWKDKKDCFSAASKASCRVGGVSSSGSASEPLRRKPETIEPLYYHALPASQWTVPKLHVFDASSKSCTVLHPCSVVRFCTHGLQHWSH